MTFWVTKARAVAMSWTRAVLGERGSANKTAGFWETIGKTRLTHRVTVLRATEAPKCTLLATLKQGVDANLMDENVDPNAPERAVCPKRPRGQAFDDEWLPDEDGIEHVCSADDSTDDDVDDDLDIEDDISMAPNVLPDRERRGRANRRCAVALGDALNVEYLDHGRRSQRCQLCHAPLYEWEVKKNKG
eukprot:jgi/Picre1/34434/NNA_001902.t1